nr:unnamed protein product [Digitaria exilis]
MVYRAERDPPAATRSPERRGASAPACEVAAVQARAGQCRWPCGRGGQGKRRVRRRREQRAGWPRAAGAHAGVREEAAGGN